MDSEDFIQRWGSDSLMAISDAGKLQRQANVGRSVTPGDGSVTADDAILVAMWEFYANKASGKLNF